MMKKILLAIVIVSLSAAFIFGMGNTENLEKKAASYDEKNIIAHLEMLENFDVLLNMEFLEKYGDYITKEITEVE